MWVSLYVYIYNNGQWDKYVIVTAQKSSLIYILNNLRQTSKKMEDNKDEKAAKKEEKKQQWESFVRKSKTKTRNHTTMVRFYNTINNALILSVILLSGKN